MSQINIPLLILDFVVLLPVTILRLIIIYFYGSRYNIPILDLIMHAEKKYFNKGKGITTIKTGFNTTINDMLNNKDSTKTIMKDKQINKYVPFKTSVDSDLEKLTHLVSGLIEQRKKVKNTQNKSENISNQCTNSDNEFKEITEQSSEQTDTSLSDDTCFSFKFSDNSKSDKLFK